MTQKVLLSMLAAGVTPVVAYAQTEYAKTLSLAVTKAEKVTLKDVPAGTYKVCATDGVTAVATGATEGIVTLAAKGNVEIDIKFAEGTTGGAAWLVLVLNDTQKQAIEAYQMQLGGIKTSIEDAFKKDMGDDTKALEAAKKDASYQAAANLSEDLFLLSNEGDTPEGRNGAYKVYCKYEVWAAAADKAIGEKVVQAVAAIEAASLESIANVHLASIKAKLDSACELTVSGTVTKEDSINFATMFKANERMVFLKDSLAQEIPNYKENNVETKITEFADSIGTYWANYQQYILDATNGSIAVTAAANEALQMLYDFKEKGTDAKIYADTYAEAQNAIHKCQLVIEAAKTKTLKPDWDEVKDAVDGITSAKDAALNTYKAQEKRNTDGKKLIADYKKVFEDGKAATGLTKACESALEDLKKEEAAFYEAYKSHDLKSSYTVGKLYYVNGTADAQKRWKEITDLYTKVNTNNTALATIKAATVEAWDFEGKKAEVAAIEYELLNATATADVETAKGKYTAAEAAIDKLIEDFNAALTAAYNAGTCENFDKTSAYKTATATIPSKIGQYTATASEALAGHKKAATAIRAYLADVDAIDTYIASSKDRNNYAVRAETMGDSTYRSIIDVARADVQKWEKELDKAALNTGANHADSLKNFVTYITWTQEQAKIKNLISEYGNDLARHKAAIFEDAKALSAKIGNTLKLLQDTLDKANDILNLNLEGTSDPVVGSQKHDLGSIYAIIKHDVDSVKTNLWTPLDAALKATDPEAGKIGSELAAIGDLLYGTAAKESLEKRAIDLYAKVDAAQKLVAANLKNQTAIKTDAAKIKTDDIKVDASNWAFKDEYAAAKALYYKTLNDTLLHNVDSLVNIEKFIDVKGDSVYTNYKNQLAEIQANVDTLIARAKEDDKIYAAYIKLQQDYSDNGTRPVAATIKEQRDLLNAYQATNNSGAFAYYNGLLNTWQKEFEDSIKTTNNPKTAKGIEAAYCNRLLLVPGVDGDTLYWNNKMDKYIADAKEVIKKIEDDDNQYAALKEKADAIWKQLEACTEQTVIVDENGDPVLDSNSDKQYNMPAEYKAKLDSLEGVLKAELEANDQGDYVKGKLYTSYANGQVAAYAEENELDNIKNAVWEAFGEYGGYIAKHNSDAYLQFSAELALIDKQWSMAVKTVEKFYNVRSSFGSNFNTIVTTCNKNLWEISGALSDLDKKVQKLCKDTEKVYNGIDGAIAELTDTWADNGNEGYGEKIENTLAKFLVNANNQAWNEYQKLYYDAKNEYTWGYINDSQIKNFAICGNDVDVVKSYFADAKIVLDAQQATSNAATATAPATYEIEGNEYPYSEFALDYALNIKPALDNVKDVMLVELRDKVATEEWNHYDLANTIDRYIAEIESFGFDASSTELKTLANYTETLRDIDATMSATKTAPNDNMYTWMNTDLSYSYIDGKGEPHLWSGVPYTCLKNINKAVQEIYEGFADARPTSEGNKAAVAELTALWEQRNQEYEALQLTIGALYAAKDKTGNVLDPLKEKLDKYEQAINDCKQKGGAIKLKSSDVSYLNSLGTEIEEGYKKILKNELNYLKNQATEALFTYTHYVSDDNKAFYTDLHDGILQFSNDCEKGDWNSSVGKWNHGKYYDLVYDQSDNLKTTKDNPVAVAKLLQAEGVLAKYLTQLASINDPEYGTRTVNIVKALIQDAEIELNKSKAKLDKHIAKYTDAELAWDFDNDTQDLGGSTFSNKMQWLEYQLTDLNNGLSEATIKMYHTSYVKTVSALKEKLAILNAEIENCAQKYADNLVSYNNYLGTLAGYENDLQALESQLDAFKWINKYYLDTTTGEEKLTTYYQYAETERGRINSAKDDLKDELKKLTLHKNALNLLEVYDWSSGKYTSFEERLAGYYKAAAYNNSGNYYSDSNPDNNNYTTGRGRELYNRWHNGYTDENGAWHSALSWRVNRAINSDRKTNKGNVWTTEAKAMLKAGYDALSTTRRYDAEIGIDYYNYGLLDVAGLLNLKNQGEDGMSKGNQSELGYNTLHQVVYTAQEGTTYWQDGYNDIMKRMDEIEQLYASLEAILEDADGQYKYVVGDVDADGEVTVLDYDMMLGMILQKDGFATPSADNALRYEAADANGNNDVEVGDLTKILNILRGVYYPSAVRGKALTDALSAGVLNEALTLSTTAMGDVTRIAISLNGTGRYAAAQLDITLPEGAEIAGEVVGAGAAELSLSSNVLANGKHRIVLSSINGAAIEGEGAIILVDVRGANGIAIDNAMVADAAANLYRLAPVACGDATAIAGVEAQDGIMQRIYNVGGQLMNGIKRGINIIVGADGKATKVAKK